jgi:hypothetical protein
MTETNTEVALLSGDVMKIEREFPWPAVNQKGQPIGKSPDNVLAYLKECGVQAKFNEFDLQTYVLVDERQLVLSDSLIRGFYIDMCRLGCMATKELVHDVVLDLGRRHAFHPVRDYVDGLEWDGRARLDKLLPHYARAEDSPLNRAMGRGWMISAVRRVRKPGTKVDAMLVLAGPQGAGKSSFFRVLASDPWFSDNLEIGAGSKEVIENNSGTWIVELAELSGIGKRDVDKVKAFISRQEDRARTAYARVADTVPRQCVFAGTTNRKEFLIDDTGSRRFWIADVTKVRLEALKSDRDQLWAEAAHYEAAGECHNIDAGLWGDAETIGRQHEVEDPVAERTEELLRGIGDNAHLLNDDLFLALRITDVTKRGGQTGRSVSTGVRRAGWEPHRSNGNRFVRTAAEAQVRRLFEFTEQGGLVLSKDQPF